MRSTETEKDFNKQVRRFTQDLTSWVDMYSKAHSDMSYNVLCVTFFSGVQASIDMLPHECDPVNIIDDMIGGLEHQKARLILRRTDNDNSQIP